MLSHYKRLQEPVAKQLPSQREMLLDSLEFSVRWIMYILMFMISWEWMSNLLDRIVP